MIPCKPTYVIWDNAVESIVLYYLDNKGNKAKALFTSNVLAEDAVDCMVRNEGRSVTELSICTIEKLRSIRYE